MQPDDVREDWAERSGQFSPAYYAEIGPNEVSETLADVFNTTSTTTPRSSKSAVAPVATSHTSATTGLRDLTGIDINDDSFDVMAEQYPGLAETGTFHTGALEDLLPEFDDDAFDAVYTVETLQHVHPDDAWVFDEFARVTSDLLVTAENEGNSPNRGRGEAEVSYVNDEFPLYHRDWNKIFSERGFAQLIREPTSRDTIRVFRVI